MEKFKERCLPPKESFYSLLNDEHITDADYDHVARVFDVFENFRNVCVKAYNLDPCHFYTSTGLAWQACLKITNVELELLTDPDMYLFIEEGLRGGISTTSNRFSKVNNPYVPNVVMYLDANNLYGWGMSQPLPSGEFHWLTEQDVTTLEIQEIPDDNEQGYFLEVGLHYPKELHDLHNDYPLAPEKMKIASETLIPYCQQLAKDLKLGGSAVPKLVPGLQHKTNYG